MYHSLQGDGSAEITNPAPRQVQVFHPTAFSFGIYVLKVDGKKISAAEQERADKEAKDRAEQVNRSSGVFSIVLAIVLCFN